MMKHLIAAVALAVFAVPATAAAIVGQPAPAFTATDSNGRKVSLADYRGKPVVLEWTDPTCPFVEKHYSSGNMQRQQADARKGGAVWLAINSEAAGKPGHMSGAEANAWLREQGAAVSAYLIDGDGSVGRAYGARTTPHMFVIAPDGTLAYAGAIDDVPSADPADIARAQPLVKEALAAVQAGKPVTTPTSRPYGCSVRY